MNILQRRWPRRIGLALLILLAVYVVLRLLADPAPDHAWFRADEGPLVIAHQGGDGLWPGNTLFAFERAWNLGVDVLEMDMHASADGTLVLMHDATVERTTDGNGAINELTLGELKELDAGYDWSPDDGATFPYRGQGISVPTLDEVFAAFPQARFNIEIKQAQPSITAPFCTKIREYGLSEQVLVGSFHDEALQEFRQVCPEVATSTGQNEVIVFFALQLLFLDDVYSPAAEALQVPETRSGLRVLSPRFVRAAHSRNLDVHAWTINDTADMRRLLELGLDGIITDYPDRLLAVLEE
ncbi:MAG: glycerophosphodiester phosphodiesterase [Candidatus Promineifilaceae bacterium]|nr:glycerophosphodiester phosphodiesterase [Candidatus Promineifilaceae bacterium]